MALPVTWHVAPVALDCIVCATQAVLLRTLRRSRHRADSRLSDGHFWHAPALVGAPDSVRGLMPSPTTRAVVGSAREPLSSSSQGGLQSGDRGHVVQQTFCVHRALRLQACGFLVRPTNSGLGVALPTIKSVYAGSKMVVQCTTLQWFQHRVNTGKSLTSFSSF